MLPARCFTSCSSWLRSTKHDRRELLHFNVTSNATAAWIWQQVLEATPWGRQPDYLIHDRNATYGRDFGYGRFTLGITGV
jgi:hypothetical protein